VLLAQAVALAQQFGKGHFLEYIRFLLDHAHTAIFSSFAALGSQHGRIRTQTACVHFCISQGHHWPQW